MMVGVNVYYSNCTQHFCSASPSALAQSALQFNTTYTLQLKHKTLRSWGAKKKKEKKNSIQNISEVSRLDEYEEIPAKNGYRGTADFNNLWSLQVWENL